jgi:hypothetical protein
VHRGAVGHWGNPDIGWINAGGNPEAGKWHHLVYTYDGTTTRVYSDGALMNQEVLTLNTHANTSFQLAAQLDADGTTVTAGLRGSLTLGRVRIHDGVLSNAQVQANYNLERAAFTDPRLVPRRQALRPAGTILHHRGSVRQRWRPCLPGRRTCLACRQARQGAHAARVPHPAARRIFVPQTLWPYLMKHGARSFRRAAENGMPAACAPC